MWVSNFRKDFISLLSGSNLTLCFRFSLEEKHPEYFFTLEELAIYTMVLSYFTEQRVRMAQEQDHASQIVWLDKSSVITGNKSCQILFEVDKSSSGTCSR